MGISTDIMHGLIQKEIRQLYSSFDGWKMLPQQQESGYDGLFRLTRLNNGNPEIASVLVTLQKEVNPDMLVGLGQTNSVSSGRTAKNTYTILVPNEADVSRLPPELNIVTMKSFRFEGKDLAWVKKPVRKTTTPETRTAVSAPAG